MNKIDANSEFKHSIRIYLLIYNGPTSELAAYLIKSIDIIDSLIINNDPTRELIGLSYAIIESVANHVSKHVASINAAKGLTEEIMNLNDELLIAIIKLRKIDKIQAKYNLLRIISKLLNALAAATKSEYPTICDVHGNKL